AFSIGAVVQWVSRLLLSYDFLKKPKWTGAIFGGLALSAITYFILIKGISGTPFADRTYGFIGDMTIKDFLESSVYQVMVVNFLAWAVISYVLIMFANTNIYKLI